MPHLLSQRLSLCSLSVLRFIVFVPAFAPKLLSVNPFLPACQLLQQTLIAIAVRRKRCIVRFIEWNFDGF
jgi:hypothetical protein